MNGVDGSSSAAHPVGVVSSKEHVLESEASIKSRKEHVLVDHEELLIVEDVLSMERVRLENLLNGAIGFHVLGTDEHLFLVLHGSSKHKNL